ncbi:MAG: hypothetical protein JHC35_07340 [Sulfuricurvum sp.]|jgi:hypothetical protein|uniref:hypothetical protein n=1 Tax=Sulfuricurvum sp. TaxID=2025608 RepID=UPI0025D3AF5A|nr:hypothetical protein [Sulfuricurvum sp.]MCI4407081.1 hypothetical protein [Sulfuricurvum sp.]
MQTLLEQIQSQLIGRYVHFATSEDLLALLGTRDAQKILSELSSYPFAIYHESHIRMVTLTQLDWNGVQIIFIIGQGAFFVTDDKTSAENISIQILGQIENFLNTHISLPCDECEGKSDPSIPIQIAEYISEHYNLSRFPLIIDSPRGQFFSVLPNLASLAMNKSIMLNNGDIIPAALIIDDEPFNSLDRYNLTHQNIPRWIILKGIGIVILGDDEQHSRSIGKAIKREITQLLTAEQLGGIL